MVSEMRVPSSSSSERCQLEALVCTLPRLRTDCDGLDLDALLDVGGAGVVRLLVLKDRLAAEGVDERCAAW
jgi:hypothetical protein